MLNRSQVGEVKALPDLGAPTAHWNGIPILTDVCPRLTDIGEICHSEPSVTVEVPGASAIYGSPVFSHCLPATRGGVVSVPLKSIRLFEHAQIVGWRSIKTLHGFYSSATQWRSGDTQWLLTSPDEGYAYQAGAVARLSHSFGDRVDVPGFGMFLGYLEPGNFGSWLFRGLPKLLYFLESGLEVDYLVVPERYAYIIETLGRLGKCLPIYTCRESIGLEFRHLYCVDDFDAEGVFCPSSVRRLQSFSSPKDVHPSRLYVSRRLNLNSRPRYRPLLNEWEIEQLFQRRGYSVIHPETLTFSQQVDLFAGASVIFGPSGSGMLNSQFARPGVKVFDIESFTYTIRQHSRIYGSTGKDYSFIFGEIEGVPGDLPHFQPWRLDLAVLEAAIASVV